MSSGKQRVLVVAPEFPAINQPWIDTYIEHLLGCGFAVSIASRALGKSQAYQSRVDELGLLELAFRHRVDPQEVVGGLFAEALCRPLTSLRAGMMALRLPASRYGASARARVALLDCQLAQRGFPDVIHGHSEVAGYDFALFAAARGIPYVHTFHGLPPVGVGQLAPDKRDFLYGTAARVVVNTQFAVRQVVSLGCPEHKVEVLPQGLPLERFPYKPAAHASPLRLLTVGRFHPDKGHRFALLAMARLARLGAELRYDIVGVGPDARKIWALATRLGLDDRVSVHEALPSERLAELYAAAHVFLLPSVTPHDVTHIETQGVVLQEAQASGVVVVATATGGIPECLDDGDNAIVVRERSSRAIADALGRLAGDANLFCRLQSAAREHVERNYSAEVIGRSMERILRSAITGGFAAADA